MPSHARWAAAGLGLAGLSLYRPAGLSLSELFLGLFWIFFVFGTFFRPIEILNPNKGRKKNVCFGASKFVIRALT